VGYYKQQLRDLESTINAVPADVVVSATPFSLGSLLTLNKPIVQITYELAERGEPRLSDLVRSFLWKQGLSGRQTLRVWLAPTRGSTGCEEREYLGGDQHGF